MERLIAKMGINFNNGPTPDRGAVPNPAKRRRHAFSAVAFLAVLAVGLLFLLPGGHLQAQDDGTIEYAENGTGAVATYTAVDPEMTAVKWTLRGADAGDFMIDNGVLRFAKSPNYEKPTDGDHNNDGDSDDDGEEASNNMYMVTIVATDATRREGTEEVTVNVTNVDEQGTVELTTLRPRAGVAVTASVSDPDTNETGHKWQWAKSRNRTSGWRDIDKATASMYTPADADAGYYLRATVTYKDRESVRDTKTAEAVSANTVQAARSQNEAPEFPDQDLETEGDQSGEATRKVAENTAAGEAIGDPVVATDGDGDILTYTLVAAPSPDADDVDSFAIDWATGQLMTKGKLDFEDDANQDDEYVVVVRVTDPDGMPEADTMDADNSDEITVTIEVTEVNEAPDITGEAAVSFAEDGDITTMLDTYAADDPEEETPAPTLALAGADRGKFDFDTTTGILMFKPAPAPDYEKPGDANKDNVYEVTVEATDAVGNTGTKDVKVTVTNADEPGTVTMSQRQPRVGVPITASLTDPDGDASNVTWQWSRSQNQNGTFDAIAKATSATYKPVGDDVAPNRMYLRATATYTDGHGEGKTAMGDSDNLVDEDTRNEPPAFDDQDDDTMGVQNDETTIEVAENTAVSGNVGSPVTATDPAPNSDALVYTLEGADADSFTITSDGQIQVGAGTKLDYETKRTYMVTVKAADSYGDYATIMVTIMVTEVDEMPEIMGEATAEYPENDTGAVATYTAVDPEMTAVKWTLRGADAGDFMIDNGVLRFAKSPNYEKPTDGDHNNDGDSDDDGEEASNNMYMVTIVATDATRREGTEEVTVNVTNVDEQGDGGADDAAAKGWSRGDCFRFRS